MIGNEYQPSFTSTDLDDIPAGAKILWVTSTGGHLSELSHIERSIRSSSDSVWVTSPTAQTLAFLEGRRHHLVEYVAPRDLKAALRAGRSVMPLLRGEQFDYCISTGAAIAATVLPLAARAGIPTYYVESLARPTAPSLTGKILARAPGVRTLTQYPEWSSKKWPCIRSALDGWQALRGSNKTGPLKIVVTLGTIHPYRFDRAVDAMLKVIWPGDEVKWQLGCTTRRDLPGTVVGQISQDQLTGWARNADVVVAHGGVGSIFEQFHVGKSPVLAIRSGQFNEHVDDHQLAFAETAVRRGLASILDLSAPCRSVLEQAAGRRVASVHALAQAA